MATDAFTNSNGTFLSAHTAGGVTWAGLNSEDAIGAIIDGCASTDAENFSYVSARAANSSSDYSQIVFKAGAYLSESKMVNVRTAADSNGYRIIVQEVTAGNITRLVLQRHESGLSDAVVSIPTNVDHTVAIKATTVGADVQIRAWVDGALVTWNDTNSDDSTDSTVFTDLAANIPIFSGNPGFTCGYFDDITPESSAFDDWTDVEPGGAGVEITSIDDVTVTHGQTSVTITGTGFSATGNEVIVSPTDDIDDPAAVSQTVTSESTTSIDFTADLDTFSFTTLYVFVRNTDDESNEDGEPISRIVASATLNFTGGAGRFVSETGAPVQQSGITFYVWRAPRPTGTPDQIFTSQSTNANGEISLSLTLGSLDAGDEVFFLAFAPDGVNRFGAGVRVPDYA